MTRRRIALAGTVAAIAATVLLLGGVLREPADDGEAAPPPVGATPAQLATVFGASQTGETTATIAGLQDKVRANPKDARSAMLLGLAYQQRVRETADFSYLAKSDAVLRRALKLDPTDADTVGGLGSLALARHDFERALAFGRRARTLAPATARHLGVVGDALLELGRYEEAFATFDAMVRRKPDVASYARISYARELLGDKRGAIAAMQLALDAATGQREARAWTHVQLGKILLGSGQLKAAEAHFLAAEQVSPDYLYAIEARAQVALALGRYGAAAALAQRAAEAVPLPQLVGTLAEIYRASGQTALAREQYAVMDAIERLLGASGVRSDLEVTLFNVDHRLRLDKVVPVARRAQRARPSIEGDDVLSWALARTGRCTEALHYSERALRLGTRDATKFFHRGTIERCLGHRDSARTWFRRALATNPHFSPYWAAIARRYAR